MYGIGIYTIDILQIYHLIHLTCSGVYRGFRRITRGADRDSYYHEVSV